MARNYKMNDKKALENVKRANTTLKKHLDRMENILIHIEEPKRIEMMQTLGVKED